MRAKRDLGTLDLAGAICSMACAIHCAMVPVLLATLPNVASLRWLSDPLFHQIVAVVCGAIVLRSLVPSVQVHGDRRPLVVATGGMSLLFIAAFILPDSCCVMPEAVDQAQIARPRITLISTAGVAAEKVTTAKNPNTISGRALSVEQLIAMLGYESTKLLVDLNRYFTPIGGVLLIVAHLWNLSRRTCCSMRCATAIS